MKELYRRGIIGALALLHDRSLAPLTERWSPKAVSVAGLVLARTPQQMPAPIGVWAEATLLSTTLGLHRLRTETATLQRQLDEGDLEGARRTAAPLVQRDVSNLDAAALAAGGVTAIADASTDGVIAPLCYYFLMGLPGPMLYRLIVSMRDTLGPQGAEIVRWARVVPAQATSALVLAAAHLCKENGVRAWRIWRRDGGCTIELPERAPRSALAGALGIELADETIGTVGAGERPPEPADVSRAMRLARTATALGAGLMLTLALIARLRK